MPLAIPTRPRPSVRIVAQGRRKRFDEVRINPSEYYSLGSAAQAAGISATVLRSWETRYHWPNSLRNAVNARLFGGNTVIELRRVAEAVRMGVSIGELITDGAPNWGRVDQAIGAPPKKVAASMFVWPSPDSSLPTLYARMQRDLLRAFACHNVGAATHIVHEYVHIPPAVRKCLYGLPLDAAKASKIPAFTCVIDLARQSHLID